MSDASATPRAVLKIINPDATAEEVAALTAVIAAAIGTATPPSETPPSLWAAPQSRVRPPLRHSPGAWRASGLPR